MKNDKRDKGRDYMKEVRRAIRREMPPPSQVHADKRFSKKARQRERRDEGFES